MSNETWILVADGARARILRDRGARPERVLERTEEHPPNREIDSDRPGRVREGLGHSRHALSLRSDTHRERKRRLARELASLLREANDAERFARLVLVAPPACLGDLRAHLPTSVAARVIAEIAKDLTHLTDLEVREYLDDTLGAPPQRRG